MSELMQSLSELEGHVNTKEARSEMLSLERQLSALQDRVQAGGMSELEVALGAIQFLDKALRLTVKMANGAATKAKKSADLSLGLETQLAAMQQNLPDRTPARAYVDDLVRGGVITTGGQG